MFAKLFSRVSESSLMELPIDTRYVFLMLLAIADPQGNVIGTDIAIARRINIPLDNFRSATKQLMEPDPDSNSQEEEGRRLVSSDCGRGYRIVNYVTYRNTRDEDHRREYMRSLMAEKRKNKVKQMLAPVSNVSTVSTCYHPLAQAEAEADADHSLSNAVELPPGFPKTEQEAVDRAFTAGVPEDFIRTTWKLAMGRGGRDSRDVLIRSWVHHLQTAYTFGKSREAEQTEKANGRARIGQAASERKTGWKEPQDQTLMPKRLL